MFFRSRSSAPPKTLFERWLSLGLGAIVLTLLVAVPVAWLVGEVWSLFTRGLKKRLDLSEAEAREASVAIEDYFSAWREGVSRGYKRRLDGMFSERRHAARELNERILASRGRYKAATGAVMRRYWLWSTPRRLAWAGRASVAFWTLAYLGTPAERWSSGNMMIWFWLVGTYVTLTLGWCLGCLLTWFRRPNPGSLTAAP